VAGPIKESGTSWVFSDAPLKKSQTDVMSSPLQASSIPALVILNQQHIVLLWLHLSHLASHVFFILT
jgi:hypothetical protein